VLGRPCLPEEPFDLSHEVAEINPPVAVARLERRRRNSLEEEGVTHRQISRDRSDRRRARQGKHFGAPIPYLAARCTAVRHNDQLSKRRHLTNPYCDKRHSQSVARSSDDLHSPRDGWRERWALRRNSHIARWLRRVDGSSPFRGLQHNPARRRVSGSRQPSALKRPGLGTGFGDRSRGFS